MQKRRSGNKFYSFATLILPVFLSLIFLFPGRAESAGRLFSILPAGANPAKNLLGASPGEDVYPIVLDTNLFDQPAGAEIILPLPDGFEFHLVHDRIWHHGDGSRTWTAYIKEEGKKSRVFLTENNGAILGRIKTADGMLRIKSDTDGVRLYDQRFANRISSFFQNDTVVPPVKKGIDGMMAVPKVSADVNSNTTIDVMVLYSSGFAADYPEGQLAARLNEFISLSNQAYVDSQVNITLRLVHSLEIACSESESNSSVLDAMTNGTGIFSGIADLRSQYGADLVVLVRPYTIYMDECGLAWINGANQQDISLYAETGFSSILDGEYSIGSTTYFCSDYTFTHELGHNMGCVHDRAHADTPGVYAYSYGYGISGSFGTIMSYIDPAVPYFSNPDINSCNGHSCGVDENVVLAANNALSLNNVKGKVAAFAVLQSCPDTDSDGICDDSDNCPDSANADQDDSDDDGTGDVCETDGTPIIGDWDGDGDDNVGLVSGKVFRLDYDNDGVPDVTVTFGRSDDIPVVGDWEGNGVDDIGVFRAEERRFYLDDDRDGVSDYSVTIGRSSDLPVVGDWDNDGKDDIGVFRPSVRRYYMDFDENGIHDRAVTIGRLGDYSLVGDWNGDGSDSIGIYRPDSRRFYLDDNDDGIHDHAQTFGADGDIPLVGDWNGDGITDIGVYRPSSGTFYLDDDFDGLAEHII
ncbi:MAG: hypothetical protein HY885_18480 [Deltaproteobacteria bacterium]|nr:hypothetical protein [Deltaproteobacteria bacterium]